MTATKKNQPSKDVPTKCAHPGCHCRVPPGKKYCSEFCENIVGADTCACGHPECKNNA